MDLLDHLSEEHRKAERLLGDLRDADPGPRRVELIDELDQALTLHMAVEERFLYPIAADVLDSEEVEGANNEHDLAREGLGKLREHASEPGFGAVVDMVAAGIDHHVHDEESEMFPELRRRAGDRIEALDPEECEATVERDGGRAARAGSSSGGGDAAVSDEVSKQELYALAQEADIPGRSQMSKEELIDALRQQ